MDIFYNYKIEASSDDKTYQEVVAYDGEYVTSLSNRTSVNVFLTDYAASDGKVYVRLSNVDPSQQYGTGITSFTINYREPLSSDS